MSTWVTIKGCITFAPNIGVIVNKSALELTGDEIKGALNLAYSHIQDKPLVDACGGGTGPLSDLGQITYEDYLIRLRDVEIALETQRAKTKYSQLRRSEYSARRPQLILALIESGMPYICVHPECKQTTNLTIDHIIPLSKGGTDDIENLQFMCQPHNSSKGDKNA